MPKPAGIFGFRLAVFCIGGNGWEIPDCGDAINGQKDMRMVECAIYSREMRKQSDAGDCHGDFRAVRGVSADGVKFVLPLVKWGLLC